ncbi:hypothetical protein [Cohnella zeiphila]|uniref:Uncharacterized protein n=1 Tax=Cohnella zeiphila TaxID=2761120 RepID=A0A7X0VZQ6_9BACL|nr:hypothetical protein [Cohnella zeiphila]MBB6735787.1 hypothetical protein [Cohnella zeiphila]
MKIGAFVMGGLAGAALVMMCRRNGMLSMAAGQLGNRMRGMKEESVGRMMSWRFGDGDHQWKKDHHDREDGREGRRDERKASSSSRGGLDEVARIASQDSDVQRHVNEILEQSEHHRI